MPRHDTSLAVSLPLPLGPSSTPSDSEAVMKRTSNNQSQWLVILTATSALLLLLALLALTLTHAKYSSSAADYDHRRFANPDHNFIDGDNSYSLELPRLPRFAYLLTGSKGEGPQLKRLLQAAYHPRNHYLLHLDLEASDAERLDLAKYVKSESVMHAFRNAMVVGAADLVTAKGPTVMAATLHTVVILLKRAGDWDWFINLSASDYPLMSQERESRSGGEEERERRERKREREKYEICVDLIL